MAEQPTRYDQAAHLPVPGCSGVTIVPRPDTSTVALSWLVPAGSRYDRAGSGVARLTEQLVFRGADLDRGSLIASIEAWGGEARSFTTREFAGYSATVAAPYRTRLLELLPELHRHPRLSPDAFGDAQRAVVWELQRRTRPDDLLWDLVLEALWATDPLARSPLGSVSSVLAIRPEEVEAFHAAHYHRPSPVLAVAGACSVDELAAACAPLEAATGAAERRPAPTAPEARGSACLHRAGPGDVTHLAVAVPAPGLDGAARPIWRLLDYTLGRGGSSRLHREVRERRALAYTCDSLYMPFQDAGVLVARAVCAPASADEVVARLGDCLLGLVSEPVTTAELRTAQHRYAGALYRAFERNASLSQLLAIETLLGAWEPFEISLARVEAVTPEALSAEAARHLRPERMVQASLGPRAPAGVCA